MEECEALCTRLAIMVNGNLKCLGTTQYLKEKFGNGYSVAAKIVVPPGENTGNKVQAYQAHINQSFPGAVLQDSHEGYVSYRVPYEAASLAALFGAMERSKAYFSVQEYSVCQASLEQVFLSLARGQIPSSEARKSNFDKAKDKCMQVCCRRKRQEGHFSP